VDALRSIAEQVLSNVKIVSHSLYEVATTCTRIFCYFIFFYDSSSFYSSIEIHNTVLRCLNTGAHSSKYLDLLNAFQTLLQKKREASESLTLRLMRGLEKLNLVSDTVAETQQNLARTAPMLEQATQETEGLLDKLTQRRAEAERTRAAVKEEEEKATQAAAEAKELADSAEEQLSQALPALQAAIKAVGKLSRKDIPSFIYLYVPFDYTKISRR
jgi:dynein heavy chain, axonemal